MLPPNVSLFALHTFARENRRQPTRSEAMMWDAVRDRRCGFKARRQHVLCPYIVDFYVASHRLVVEIDGGVHESSVARERDAVRDAELARLYDVRVLRIDAALVERDVASAVALVHAAL